MRHRVAAALVGIVLALTTLPARAEPTPAQQSAMRHWESGLKLFEDKKYQEALGEFAQGYALSHKAGFLFNMAECARLLGDKPQAHQLYRRYLGEHPQGKLRAEALAHCRELGVGPCEAPAVAPPPPVPPVPPPKTPTAVAPARLDLVPSVASSSAPPPARPRPFYKRWPLWVGIGVVVVAGSVTAGVLATRDRGHSAPGGDATLDYTK